MTTPTPNPDQKQNERELDEMSEPIYECPNKRCKGNGFVIGPEGALWLCGYCNSQLELKAHLQPPAQEEGNDE